MSDKEKDTKYPISIKELKESGRSIQVGPNLYSNHVVSTLCEHDLFLDFFNIEPDFLDTKKYISTHVQRIVIPLGVIPGMSRMLKNTKKAFLHRKDSKGNLPTDGNNDHGDAQ